MKTFPVLPVVLLLLLFAFALSARASNYTEYTTATVTLSAIVLDEEDVDNTVLTLRLPTGEEDFVVTRDCKFIDLNGNPIEPYAFLELYRGEAVTVDFLTIS